MRSAWKRPGIVPLFLMLSSLTAGCGGGSDGGGGGNPAGPRLIEHGGVGDGAIDGTLHVHVTGGVSSAPIVGAQVRIGDAGATPLLGTTDAAGLASFRDPTLAGAQMVTVTASGHAPVTWIGVNGANVTIPLTPQELPAPEQATAAGTIDGWAGVPAPAENHMILGIIGYSAIEPLEAPVNDLPQEKVTEPSTGIELPANMCVKVLSYSACDWKLTTRTGRQIHFATILDVDTKGTLSDQSDDTYTVLDYAFLAGLDLAAGASATGETLVPVGAAGMTSLSVAFAAAPPNLTAVGARPMIAMGDAGVIVLPWPGLTPAKATLSVPSLTGDLAGGSYVIVAEATWPDLPLPVSTILARGVSLGGTVTLGSWMSLPSGLNLAGETIAYTPAPDAALHTLGVVDDQGTLRWGIAVLDGSTSFALPALDPSPLPTGQVGLRVEGVRAAGFTATDFTIDELSAATTHAAATAKLFTR
jgi:hypothetical protein